jgi:hypothetical protein
MNTKNYLLHFFVITLIVYPAIVSAGENRHCPELDSFRIKECGQSTLAECAATRSDCAIASRLHAFGFWIDTLQNDKPCSTKVAALAERYEGFNDTARYGIDLHEVAFVGSADAPVTLLLYVSATCPLCKKVYRELFSEVTRRKLLGKAKMGIKVFSIKGGDIALLAAKKFNKQSDLLLSLANVEERISEKIVLEKAHDISLPDSAFRALLKDSVLIRIAEKSALEGSKNGVTVTPTVFINNKRYRSYKDPQWIVDAALYEFETLTKKEK